MTEAKRPNVQEFGRNLRENLVNKAKEIPGGVKVVVARAKSMSPRHVLQSLAGTTPEARQRQVAVEQERRQQQEARALIAEIDRLFPETSKYYDMPFYKSRRAYEQTGVYNSQVESIGVVVLSKDDVVTLKEVKPPHAQEKGSRQINLKREYIGQDGIKARDTIDLRILPDGRTIQLESGSRTRETGRKVVYRGSDRALFGRVASGDFRPAFVGREFKDSGSVLALGREIVNAVRTAQAQPFQSAAK